MARARKRSPYVVTGVVPAGGRIVQQVRQGTSHGLRFTDKNGKRHYCWDLLNAARFLDWVESYDEKKDSRRLSVSEILKRSGMSEREMASRIGVSYEKVLDWLRGTVEPSNIAHKKMMEVLDGRSSDDAERRGVGVRSPVVAGIRPAVSEASEALRCGSEAERCEPA